MPYPTDLDGLVERLNQKFQTMLAPEAQEQPFDWEYNLHHLCMAYDTSIQATTGYTPFYLMFSHQARAPIDVYVFPPFQPSTPIDYASRLRGNPGTAYQKDQEQMNRKLNGQKEIYDRRFSWEPFEL